MAYNFYASGPATCVEPEGWYNGFDRWQRQKGGTLQRKAMTTGAMPVPSVCMVCGQTDGDLVAHLEDYDRPFDYLPLCYPCHTTLHGRYKRPWHFATWIERLEAGFRPIPFASWSWHDFRRVYLQVDPSEWASNAGPATPLDLTLYRLLPPVYTDHVPEPFRLDSAGPLPGQYIHGGTIQPSLLEPDKDYEGFARARKVKALREALDVEGLDGRTLDKKARNALARRHGVNVPSDTTWAAVLAERVDA